MHTISATAARCEPARLEQEVPEGKQTEIEIDLRCPKPQEEPPLPVVPPRPPPPSPMLDAESRPKIPLLAYVGFGAGAAGLLVGSVTGVWSWAKTSSLRDEYCHGGDVCDPGHESDEGSAPALARVSDVAFAVGVLGAAVGVVALVSDPSGSAPAPAEAAELRLNMWRPVWVLPELGAQGMALRGRF